MHLTFKQALNSEGKNSLEPFSKELKIVLLYSIKTVVSHLNQDILENIMKNTVGRYPQMQQTLRTVSRFLKHIVDTLPLPQVYIPELAVVVNIRHLIVRKIINTCMKGKNGGTAIARALRNNYR